MKPTKTEAEAFFKALRQASVEALQYYNLPLDPGHKTRPWVHGKPIGTTYHFTAGVVWKPTITHLNGSANQKSSCTMLVLDRRIGEIDSIISKYPVLDVLPVTVFQLADLKTSTWHGNWSNGYNVGIENRNAGPLLGTQENWLWWPKKWKAPFPHKSLGKTPINIDGHWWEPYTHGQIVANIILGQMQVAAFGGDERWFLPHSCIKGTKRDTGRAFPLHLIREAVFNFQDVEELTWLQAFKADPMYMDDYEEEIDAEFLSEIQEQQGVRDDLLSFEEEKICVAPLPEPDLLKLAGTDWEDNMLEVRMGLSKLGYVPGKQSLYGYTMDTDTALAVWLFQKSVDLKPDRIPGPKTQAALLKRLKDFQLEK